MGPLDKIKILNELSSPVRFKLHEKITGKTQSGRLLGSCTFGKPLMFSGVYENYSILFFRFQETDIVKFYKNGNVVQAVKFYLGGVTSFTIMQQDHNLEVVLSEDKENKKLIAKLSLIGRRSGYITSSLRFELLNTLEYNLLKRQYHKYHKFQNEEKAYGSN